MSSVLDASKIQLLADKYELANRKDDVIYYENNNINTDVKEKQKVYILDKK